MALKKLLYTTKFRDLSFQALKELFVLKKVGLQEIVLLHLILREEVSYVFPAGFLKDEAERLKEEAELRFASWGKEITKLGLQYKSIIRIGDPLFDIPRLVEEEEIDLLVIGKKKRDAFFSVSSRTKGILSQVKVPTLVFKYSLVEEGEEIVNEAVFERPLLAIDFSAPSLRALELLADLLPLYEKALILQVIPEKGIKGLSKVEMKSLEDKLNQKLERHVKEFGEMEAQWERLILLGDPATVILDVLSERQVSLVILGKTEKTLLDRIFLGSVAQVVLDKAKIPVLLVP